jgi:50S ribosomal protein L16 3-hydroxylase
MAQLQGALDQASGNHWFGELVTEPRYENLSDDDDLAEARDILATGATVVSLSPRAKLAWQQESDGILVFANGSSMLFPASVMPALVCLCEHWRLAAQDLAAAQSDPASADLLDYLLEGGCIYVE